MKNLLIILVAAGKAYNDYISSLLAQTRSEAVRTAFKDLGREAAQAIVESGIIAESAKTTELQAQLIKGYKDVVGLVKDGFNETMALASGEKPQEEKKADVIPINLQ